MPAVLSTASAASVKGSTSLPFNEITLLFLNVLFHLSVGWLL